MHALPPWELRSGVLAAPIGVKLLDERAFGLESNHDWFGDSISELPLIELGEPCQLVHGCAAGMFLLVAAALLNEGVSPQDWTTVGMSSFFHCPASIVIMYSLISGWQGSQK